MAADAGRAIVDKVLDLGAVAAGIADLDLLKRSPSHHMLTRFGTRIDGEYSWDADHDLRRVDWPAAARSAIVIAVSHPRDEPELDWSGPTGQTPGNERLVRIVGSLSAWIPEKLGLSARQVPYSVEAGGVYVKDAAVLAGLGCIGRNNIVVTPEHGPRIRLCVVLVDEELSPTGPIEFDPCRDCGEPCRRACPQAAFAKAVHTRTEVGIAALPGRDGWYGRSRCGIQMEKDVKASGFEPDDEFGTEQQMTGPAAEPQAGGRIKWCRRCELACPVGR